MEQLGGGEVPRAPTATSTQRRKVVIDAGAVIKLQRLERFGGDLYTTRNVFSEVRDEKARALLGTLPDEIHIRQPEPRELAFVREFARGTGDLGFLSSNDIGLIALTVALHREAGGSVRQKPCDPALTTASGRFEWAPPKANEAPRSSETAAGGSVPAGLAAGGSTAVPAEDNEQVVRDEGAEGASEAPQLHDPGRESLSAATEPAGEEAASQTAQPAAARGESLTTSEQAGEEAANEPPPAADAGGESPLGAEPAGRAIDGGTLEESEAGDSDTDGSSAGEWVTVENLHRFGVGVKPATAVEDSPVTCATADYAIQNVLLQMGITPLTFDGYAVTSVKVWGLVCRACFFWTRETEKIFCPKCGNDTVVRVPIVVDHTGQPSVQHNGRRLKKRGTVYSIPKPQGGRAWKPIFAEDELRIGSRDRELRHLQRVAEKEQKALDPFNTDNGARAWWQRNTTATGKQLGVRAPRVEAGYGRRANPNANNFKHKGFKKR